MHPFNSGRSALFPDLEAWLRVRVTDDEEAEETEGAEEVPCAGNGAVKRYDDDDDDESYDGLVMAFGPDALRREGDENDEFNWSIDAQAHLVRAREAGT
jgi:hypothetical protein